MGNQIKLLTTEQARDEYHNAGLDMSIQMVIDNVKVGRILGSKFGHQYLVNPESVKEDIEAFCYLQKFNEKAREKWCEFNNNLHTD